MAAGKEVNKVLIKGCEEADYGHRCRHVSGAHVCVGSDWNL